MRTEVCTVGTYDNKLYITSTNKYCNQIYFLVSIRLFYSTFQTIFHRNRIFNTNKFHV